MINLKKRMMGLEDKDTVEGIDQDFKYLDYPEDTPLTFSHWEMARCAKDKDESAFDEHVLHQIDFIIWKVHQKSGQNYHVYAPQICDILISSQSLPQLRNNLCKFVAENKILTKNQ